LVNGRLTRFGLVIALASALAGCSSSSETAARKAVEAQALLDQGLFPAARLAAVRATTARDDVPEYWRLLGRAELQNGNLAGAYEAYSRAIELEPTDPESLQILADIALRAGRMREAVKAADQLLSLQPSLTRPRLVKGVAALAMNDEKTAEQLADEIIARDPSDEVGKVLKARVHGRRDDFASAIAMLDNPTTARSEIVLTTLVELYRSAGTGTKFAATLRELNAVMPTDARLLDLAAAEYKLDRRDAARRQLLEAALAKPTDVALHDKLFTFISEYDPTMFDGAPQALPPKAAVMLRLLAARVLIARGKPDRAKAVLDPLIGPGTSPDTWSLYAIALDGAGASGAADIVGRILAVDETNGDALLMRSTFARRRGDIPAALRDAQHVVREEPDNVQAKLAVVAAYRARGDRARARQLFEEMLQKHPASTIALRTYLAFLVETKDMARAQSLLQAFTFVNPARIDGWKIREQFCVTSACARDSAAGLERARRDFAPPAGSDVNRAGVMGRL